MSSITTVADHLAIEQLISPARLSSYKRLFSPDLGDQLGAYAWNKAVASSFMPLMQCVEITLRNAIHVEASQRLGSPMWLDTMIPAMSRKLLTRHHPTPQKRLEAQNKEKFLTGELSRAKRALSKRGKTVTADGVVGNLMFGFWVELLTQDFNDPRTNAFLWPGLIRPVFQHARFTNLATFHANFDALRALRNRISHHEPLWDKSLVATPADVLASLNRSIDLAVECIGYCSPSYLSLLEEMGFTGYLRGLCTQDSLHRFLSRSSGKKVPVTRARRDLRTLLRGLNGETIRLERDGASVAVICPPDRILI